MVEHEEDSSAGVAAKATQPEDWKVLGEGNANMVFGYVGTDPVLEGTALRVPKPDFTGDFDSVDRLIWTGTIPWHADPMLLNMHYIKEHMAPRLGEAHVHAGIPTLLPPALHNAHGVDAAAGSGARAMIVADHTKIPAALVNGLGLALVGPPVTVEIKPKSGAMPATPAAAAVEAAAAAAAGGAAGKEPVPTHARLGERYPRFVLHMLMKHLKGGQPFSSYNPLDLFSDDKAKVAQAILHLLDEPSNNLRVFRDSKLVYGGRPGCHSLTSAYAASDVQAAALEDTLRALLGEGFVAAHGGSATAAAMAATTTGVEEAAPVAAQPPSSVLQHCRALADLVAQLLLNEGVLRRLLEVQRSDALGVEVVHGYYQQALAAAHSSAAAAGDGETAVPQHPREAVPLTVLAALQGYLVAATAKDCGLMVTLQRAVPKDGQSAATAAAAGGGDGSGSAADAVASNAAGWVRTFIDPSTGALFVYKVAFVDLDVKRSAKIPQHLKLEREILEFAEQHEAQLAQLHGIVAAAAAGAAAAATPA